MDGRVINFLTIKSVYLLKTTQASVPLFFLLVLITTWDYAIAQNKRPFQPVAVEQLKDSLQFNTKPVIITIFTDWCTYCKLQDAQLSKHAALRQTVSDSFYWVALNAEDQNDMVFNKVRYSYNSSNKIHHLAEFLGTEDGKLVYPTTIVLDSSYRLLYRHQGLITGKSLHRILKAIAGTD